MQFPSPSDLCWNVKFPPEQEWIEEPLHIAVGNICERARHVARSQLGDETMAQEIIEAAIEKTVQKLQEDGHQTAEDVARLLERSLQQEVRRRRRAAKRLVYFGSNQELPADDVQNSHAQVDSSIDLEVILHGVPSYVRFALLLRYSRCRWSEVAEVLGTTEAAVRLRCKRALNRIRKKLESENHGT